MHSNIVKIVLATAFMSFLLSVAKAQPADRRSPYFRSSHSVDCTDPLLSKGARTSVQGKEMGEIYYEAMAIERGRLSAFERAFGFDIGKIHFRRSDNATGKSTDSFIVHFDEATFEEIEALYERVKPRSSMHELRDFLKEELLRRALVPTGEDRQLLWTLYAIALQNSEIDMPTPRDIRDAKELANFVGQLEKGEAMIYDNSRPHKQIGILIERIRKYGPKS